MNQRIPGHFCFGWALSSSALYVWRHREGILGKVIARTRGCSDPLSICFEETFFISNSGNTNFFFFVSEVHQKRGDIVNLNRKKWNIHRQQWKDTEEKKVAIASFSYFIQICLNHEQAVVKHLDSWGFLMMLYVDFVCFWICVCWPGMLWQSSEPLLKPSLKTHTDNQQRDQLFWKNYSNIFKRRFVPSVTFPTVWRHLTMFSKRYSKYPKLKVVTSKNYILRNVEIFELAINDQAKQV